MSHRNLTKFALTALLTAGILVPVAAHAESTQEQANQRRFIMRQLAATNGAIEQEVQKVQQSTGAQRDIEMLKLQQLMNQRQQQVEILRQLRAQAGLSN